MDSLMMHFSREEGISQCGEIILPQGFRPWSNTTPTWANVTCLRCLGRPEEAQVREAFDAAINLVTELVDHSDSMSSVKIALVSARNDAMALVAKRIPASVKEQREVARVATISN